MCSCMVMSKNYEHNTFTTATSGESMRDSACNFPQPLSMRLTYFTSSVILL